MIKFQCMERDEHEIYLLEIRQVLKDTESDLKSRKCTDLTKFRRLVKLKSEIQEALIEHRITIGQDRVSK